MRTSVMRDGLDDGDDETRFFIFYLVIYISAYIAFNAYDSISITSTALVLAENTDW
jgi:hypothetical protein